VFHILAPQFNYGLIFWTEKGTPYLVKLMCVKLKRHKTHEIGIYKIRLAPIVEWLSLIDVRDESGAETFRLFRGKIETE
jgi:hypothetical protein